MAPETLDTKYMNHMSMIWKVLLLIVKEMHQVHVDVITSNTYCIDYLE